MSPPSSIRQLAIALSNSAFRRNVAAKVGGGRSADRRQRSRRQLLAESLEDRRMLAGEVVQFMLTARDIDTDELLPNTQQVSELNPTDDLKLDYQIPEGGIFKLEVAAKDLRDQQNANGIFRVVTDILVDSKGALTPVIGEVQEITFSDDILDSANAGGTVNLFLESNPSSPVTMTVNEFKGGPFGDSIDTANNVANAIVSLNPAITSADQLRVSVLPDDKTETYNIKIVYADPALAGQDFDAVQASLFYGAAEQDVVNREFDVLDGNGQLNPERMFEFFELRSRNANNIQVYGGDRVVASYDVSDPNFDIFDEVGALGPASSQGIRASIPNFSRSVAYDVFSIPVQAGALANNIEVSLDPADVGDKVLIYGTDAGKEKIDDPSLILLDNTSKFTLDIIEPPPFVEADDASMTFGEDDAAQTIALGVTSDPGTLVLTIDVAPTLGSAVINGNSLTYTPNADANGVETFKYRATLDGTTFDRGTITVDIAAVNDAPTAEDDEFTILEDESLSIPASQLLGNDADVDLGDVNSNEQLTVISVTSASNGAASLSNGNFQYTPSPNFFGSDSVVYTMRDNAGVQRSASILIDVDAVNDAPTASNDSLNTDPNVSLTILAETLVANDSSGPLESDTLTITDVTAPAQAGSTAVLSGGEIVYTPAVDFVGTDSFFYTVSDGSATATAQVSIDVSYAVQPVILTLPDQVSDITIINDLGWLEVRDNLADVDILRRPMDTVVSLSLVGAANFANKVHVDHNAGGVIRFLNNSTTINLEGGSTIGDELRITGGFLANATVGSLNANTPEIVDGFMTRLQSSSSVSTHNAVGFESVGLDNLRQMLVEANNTLDLGSSELSVDSSLSVNLGATTRITGGTLRSESLLIVGAGDNVQASGTIDASVIAQENSTINLVGDLTIGDVASTDGADLDGTLNVNDHQLTVLDADVVGLGGQLSLGSVQGSGNLRADNGLRLENGSSVSGEGGISTPNSSTFGLENSGSIQGSSPANPIVLAGFVGGQGLLNNVVIDGTWDPNQGTATTPTGQVAIGATGEVLMQIGGTVAGQQYDQVDFDPSGQLGGNLSVELVNNFSPRAGHSFDLFTSASSITGSFATESLPNLAEGLKWQLSQAGGTLTANVVLDGEALDENIQVEIDNNELVIRSQSGAPIPISGSTLTLDVEPMQTFESPQVWSVQSTEVVDGKRFQLATSGTATLRVAGTGWTNFVRPQDVNGSGNVSALDALIIINELNSPGFSLDSLGTLVDYDAIAEFPGSFFDVNRSGNVSAVDALQVINFLIAQDQGGNAEPIADFAVPVAASTPQNVSSGTLGPAEIESLDSVESKISDSVFMQYDIMDNEPSVLALEAEAAGEEGPDSSTLELLCSGK